MHVCKSSVRADSVNDVGHSLKKPPRGISQTLKQDFDGAICEVRIAERPEVLGQVWGFWRRSRKIYKPLHRGSGAANGP